MRFFSGRTEKISNRRVERVFGHEWLLQRLICKIGRITGKERTDGHTNDTCTTHSRNGVRRKMQGEGRQRRQNS